MDNELFDLLVEIGIIDVKDLKALVAIRAYIATLKEQLAAALASAAASAEIVAAAQLEATTARAEATAAQALYEADQLSDAEVSLGLAEIVASIPVS